MTEVGTRDIQRQLRNARHTHCHEQSASGREIGDVSG